MTEPNFVRLNDQDAVSIELALRNPDALGSVPSVRTLGTSVADVVRAAEAADVQDEKGVEWATAVLAEIKAVRTRVETLRTSFTKPLNEHLRRLNEFFRTMDAPLEAADKDLRGRVLVYRKAVEEERRRANAERERLAAEAAAREAEARAALRTGDPQTGAILAAADAAHERADAVRVAPEPPKTVSTVFGSSTVKKNWDFEIADVSAVPREYLAVDDRLVRQAIRNGVREIPGLRIFQREDLAVRRSDR